MTLLGEQGVVTTDFSGVLCLSLKLKACTRPPPKPTCIMFTPLTPEYDKFGIYLFREICIHTILSSLQLLSCLFGLLQHSQGNSYNKVKNLEAAHDRKSCEKSEGAPNHRDLGHDVCFGVLGDLVNGWRVEENVHSVQF